MSEWLKVLILGIVEGVTEFVPISSTGHLIVASSLLDFQGHLRVTFDIFIQVGAVFAVLAVYRHDLLAQAASLPRSPATRRLWLGIVIAFLPFALLGFLLGDWIKAALFSPSIVAPSLMIGGVLMIAVERLWMQRREVTTRDVHALTLRQAVIVGAAQCMALIPGMSRAAASIIGGMLAGMGRTAATEFSFLLAIPTLGGATLWELLSSAGDIRSDEVGYLLVGAMVAGLVGWLSVRWLLRYISRHSFVAFGYYRIIAGALILLLVAFGRLA